jgi:hypothetical protein
MQEQASPTKQHLPSPKENKGTLHHVKFTVRNRHHMDRSSLDGLVLPVMCVAHHHVGPLEGNAADGVMTTSSVQ